MSDFLQNILGLGLGLDEFLENDIDPEIGEPKHESSHNLNQIHVGPEFDAAESEQNLESDHNVESETDKEDNYIIQISPNDFQNVIAKKKLNNNQISYTIQGNRSLIKKI